MKADLFVVPSAFVLLLRAEQTIATREPTRLALYHSYPLCILRSSSQAEHTSLSCLRFDRGICQDSFLQISEQSRALTCRYEGGLDDNDDHLLELRNP